MRALCFAALFLLVSPIGAALDENAGIVRMTVNSGVPFDRAEHPELDAPASEPPSSS